MDNGNNWKEIMNYMDEIKRVLKIKIIQIKWDR